jgi:hypothetical protein
MGGGVGVGFMGQEYESLINSTFCLAASRPSKDANPFEEFPPFPTGILG